MGKSLVSCFFLTHGVYRLAYTKLSIKNEPHKGKAKQQEITQHVGSWKTYQWKCAEAEVGPHW